MLVLTVDCEQQLLWVPFLPVVCKKHFYRLQVWSVFYEQHLQPPPVGAVV
ncbi:MAG: hypothetical protein Q4A09_01820 [Capnocytophaga felis]|nr:hypothetical protein [Capnocytophaga felis]